jgi:hypothetical protein
MINDSNVPSLDQWIKSYLFESIVEICFVIQALDFSNFKLYFPQANPPELGIRWHVALGFG